jgi:heterotetrameric sarcosine oxidase gamma subunit
VPEPVTEHLDFRPALALQPGRHGAPGGCGLTIAVRTGLQLATMIARRGKERALAAAIDEGYGVALPQGPRRAGGNGVSFVGSGPQQWLVAAETSISPDLESELRTRLGDFAAICDQSHSRLILRLEGPKLRDVLAKGLPLDLHPRAFRAGDAASSHCSHIAVQLWQLDEVPRFEIVVARGFARSFWHWLDESAAEYGYEIKMG